MSAAVRQYGLKVDEFDLNMQGRRNNLLNRSVLNELDDLNADPMCRGVVGAPIWHIELGQKTRQTTETRRHYVGTTLKIPADSHI